MEADNWKYLLINGASSTVEVKNPTYEKGKLTDIDGLRPFDKQDEEGNTIVPTIEDASELKRNTYIDFFKKPFKNVLVLSGAGSSMDVGGLSMWQLWELAKNKYTINETDYFTVIKDTVNFDRNKEDLEALLSQIDGYSKFVENTIINIEGEEKSLTTIRDEIFGLIKEKCTISKPVEFFPHKAFIEKLLQRKQTNPRVKVFTLNYDLLFEYAANEVNAIVIDGFSFTLPRTFSGRFFDYDIVQREGSKVKEEDNFIQRVFHLHKLHGSLNWERNQKGGEIIIKESPDKPLMVYPREGKYEDSYEQPYFEMMARFQRNLRLDVNTLLLCIGYSFNDKHINAAIEEALNQNPGFRLAVVDPGFDNDRASGSLKAIKKLALASDRVIMVSESFSDFATHFPEIKTYESTSQELIKLKND